MDLVGHQRQCSALDQVFVLGVLELLALALLSARASGSVSLHLRQLLQSAPRPILWESMFRRHPMRDRMSGTAANPADGWVNQRCLSPCISRGSGRYQSSHLRCQHLSRHGVANCLKVVIRGHFFWGPFLLPGDDCDSPPLWLYQYQWHSVTVAQRLMSDV